LAAEHCAHVRRAGVGTFAVFAEIPKSVAQPDGLGLQPAGVVGAIRLRLRSDCRNQDPAQKRS